jgi:predicted small integral membrane protein
MYSMWFIATDESAGSLRNRLQRAMYAGDRLYVADITGSNAAWFGLAGNINDWLARHISVPVTNG